MREGNEWVIRRVRGLRKKRLGLGIMVREFQDDVRGFLSELSEEGFKYLRGYGKTRSRKELGSTPGIQVLEYSENKKEVC